MRAEGIVEDALRRPSPRVLIQRIELQLQDLTSQAQDILVDGRVHVRGSGDRLSTNRIASTNDATMKRNSANSPGP